MSPIKTAFILGAGLGTRLRPLTNNCPKPLLPVGGRPIITYAMDHLISAGIKRFHHQHPPLRRRVSSDIPGSAVA
jgi:NDP-sugar pyrophosphorylase family protein